MTTYCFFRNVPVTGRGGKTMSSGALSHQPSEDSSDRFRNFAIPRKTSFGMNSQGYNGSAASNKSKEFTARRGGVSSNFSSRGGDKSDTPKSTDQKDYGKPCNGFSALSAEKNRSALSVGEKLMGARTGTPFGSGVWKVDANSTFKASTFKKAEVTTNGVAEGNKKKEDDGALQDVIQKNIELNKGWDDVQEEEQAREQGAAAVEKPNLAYVKPAIPIANNSATDQSAQNGKKDHQKVTFNAATGHQAVSSTSTWHPPVASTPQKMREGVESETACNLSPIVCGVSLNVRESVVVPKEVSEKFTMTKEAPLQRNGNATVDGCDAQTDNDGTSKCYQSHLSEMNIVELVIDRLHNDDRYKLFRIAESMYNSAKEFRDFVQKIAGSHYEKH